MINPIELSWYILLVWVVLNALLYAFRGNTVFTTEWEKRLEWLTAQPNPTPEQLQEIAELEKRIWPKKLRKPIYCVVTGGVFALIAYFNTSIDALNALISAIIVSLGSFLPPLTSPRPFFNSWRGADATEDTKVNAANYIQHKFAEFITNKLKGTK